MLHDECVLSYGIGGLKAIKSRLTEKGATETLTGYCTLSENLEVMHK